MANASEHTRANLEVVKRLISMREKIYMIQRELKAVHDFLDQTADEFMTHLIAHGDVEQTNYTADATDNLAG